MFIHFLKDLYLIHLIKISKSLSYCVYIVYLSYISTDINIAQNKEFTNLLSVVKKVVFHRTTKHSTPLFFVQK